MKDAPMEERITKHLAAFTEAVCDTLASVLAENVTLRALLNAKGVVLEAEFKDANDLFRQTDGRRIKTISADIRKKMKAKLDALSRP